MTRHVPTYELYGETSGKEPDFWLHCETIPSRSSLHHWEIKLHRHASFFQILYIDAGAGDAIFGERSQSIQPPAVVTVPLGLEHGFRFSKDIDGLVITMLSANLSHLPGDRSRLGEWLAAPHLIALDPDDPDAAYLMQSLRRLGDEYRSNRSGRSELLASYAALALRLTARISYQEDISQFPTDENERRMEHLTGLIQQHFRSHRPASFYAREIGISPTHLNRIVRSMTGKTAHDLIAGKLVDEAKRELVFTLANVQEVSYRLGFADPAYFSRFFLKHAGETPKDWRKRAKNRLERA